MSVLGMLSSLSGSIFKIMSNGNLLYGLYFFAFFFLLYTILFNLFRFLSDKKGNSNPLFEKKPRTVIAGVVSFISTSSLFYGKSVENVLAIFHGVLGFFFNLLLAIVCCYAVFKLLNRKRGENEKVENWEYALVFLFVYLATMFLLPQVAIYNNSTGTWTAVRSGSNTPYLARFDSVNTDVIFDVLVITNELSMLALFIFSLMFLFSLFSGKSNDDVLSEDDKEHRSKVLKTKLDLKEISEKMKELSEIFKAKESIVSQLTLNLKRYLTNKEYDFKAHEISRKTDQNVGEDGE